MNKNTNLKGFPKVVVSSSLNLRRKSHVRNKQCYEEVKNESNSKKSKIKKEKFLPKIVEDEKLFVSPIVLLEILPVDTINSIIKSPNIDFLKKSSHRNLSICTCNKTLIQNISADKKLHVNKIEQKVSNNLVSIVDTAKLKDKPINKEHIVEQEISCLLNNDVITSSSKKESTLQILNNCKEQENSTDENVAIVKGILNDFTEDEQIITEKQDMQNFTLKGINKIEYIIKLNEQKPVNGTAKIKENFYSSKGNDVKMSSIIDDESIIESCSIKHVEEEKMTTDVIENEVCNNGYDDDDEEIIFYYINSANEVVKKTDVKKRNSYNIEEIKVDKAACITRSKVDNCKENFNVSHFITSDSELEIIEHTEAACIIPSAVVNCKENINTSHSATSGSKRITSTINANMSGLFKQNKYFNVYESERSIVKKGKNLDDEAAIDKDHNIKNIDQTSINKQHENVDVDLPVDCSLNNNLTDIIQPIINTENTEIITIKRTVNTAKCKTIKININLIHEKRKILKDGQFVIAEEIANADKNIEKVKNLDVNQSTIIDKTDTINIAKSVITEKDTDVDRLEITDKDNIAGINESTYTKNGSTINLNQYTTEKDEFIDNESQVENVEKIKTAVTVYQFLNESDIIDKVAMTKSDENANVNNQPTISENNRNKNLNQSLLTENKKRANIKQYLFMQNEQNTKADQSSIAENEEITNFDASLILENETNMEINQPLLTEQNKIKNVDQTTNIKECALDEINQQSVVERNQSTTIEENQGNKNQPIKINENVKKVDDRLADEMNLDAYPNLNMEDENEHLNNDNKTRTSEVDVPLNDVVVINVNTKHKSIKVEDVDILLQDSIVTDPDDLKRKNIEDDEEINNENVPSRFDSTLGASKVGEGKNTFFEANYNDVNNDEHCREDSCTSGSETTSYGSMEPSSAMFISFMEAYQTMKKNRSVANSLLTLNRKSKNVESAVDIGPEILHITVDDSDNEVEIIESNNEDSSSTIENPNNLATVKTIFPVNSAVNPTIRRNILLPNGGTVISASKLYGCNDGISVKEENEHLFSCRKCNRVFQDKASFNKHKYKCNKEITLQCTLCLKTVIHKRSLIDHLRRIHRNEVIDNEINGIVNNIMKEAIFRKDKKIPMPSSTISIPDFVKLFCNKCGKIYDRIRPDYYRKCETCNVLLLIFCQRCNKRFLVSPKISIHLAGNCDIGEHIKCPHCNLFVNQRHQLRQHIEEAHREPIFRQTILICSKGCGRKFQHILGMRRHEKYCGTKASLHCKFCKYKTRHRSAIKVHMQQHFLRNDTVMVQRTNLSDSDSSDSCTNIPVVAVDEENVRKLMEAFCSKCNVAVPMPPRNIVTCNICSVRLLFSCSRCYQLPSRSRNYRDVRVHVIRCHADKIYKCSSCKRRFALHYDYSYHKANCDKNRKYQCHLCPYNSNLPKGLQAHLRRIHPNGLLEFHRCTKCMKNFSSKNTLQKHLRFFCRVFSNFSCAHCNFSTRSKFSLVRHIQNKHSEIFEYCTFQCVYCQKVYNNLYAHDTHVVICRRNLNK